MFFAKDYYLEFEQNVRILAEIALSTKIKRSCHQGGARMDPLDIIGLICAVVAVSIVVVMF